MNFWSFSLFAHFSAENCHIVRRRSMSLLRRVMRCAHHSISVRVIYRIERAGRLSVASRCFCLALTKNKMTINVTWNDVFSQLFYLLCRLCCTLLVHVILLSRSPLSRLAAVCSPETCQLCHREETTTNERDKEEKKDRKAWENNEKWEEITRNYL